MFSHKATEGTWKRHTHCGEALKRARAAGMPWLGAYHVVRSGASVADQARYYLAYLDEATPWWRQHPGWMHQVDLERWSYDPVAAATGQAYCREVQRQAGHGVVLLYASRGQYGDSLAGVGVPLWNAAYPTWSSALGVCPPESYRTSYTRSGGDTGKGWVAYSGQVPLIWQYSDNATIGTQPHCDANAIRDEVAWRRLFSATFVEDDMNAEQDAKLNAVYGWVQQMLTMDLKPENSLAYWLRQVASGVDTANTALTEDAVRDKAMLAAFQAMVAGGTSVDTAAVIGAVHELRDEFGPQLADLRARAERAEAERDQFKARLAAAFGEPTAPAQG